MGTNTFDLVIDGAIKASYSIDVNDCGCKKSKPAKSFSQLVDLVKQAEEVLIKNDYHEMGDRISILRGIYYGTTWSLDYSIEKSTSRNLGFDLYAGSTPVADAREALKCSEECEADLFKSFFNSYEVFENKYKAVDFGHIIIGMDSRRSWRAKTIEMPATGLEMNTWVGDLGGGTGKLAFDRVKKPKKRAKVLFPVFGNSYGAMVNLEGDIAAYVVGMDKENESKIDDPTDNFKTIHEALKDYFDNKWGKRTYYFLKMLDGEFKKGKLVNKQEVIEYCTEAIDDFSSIYLGLRMKEKESGDLEDFTKAAAHFESIAEEVATIFVDGLLHVVKNPSDMITARIDPDPKPRDKTTAEKINSILEKAKNIDLNPFD